MKKKDYFEANESKKIMGNKNSLFSGFNPGDAKDLYFYLIDSFLWELTEEKIKIMQSKKKMLI